MKKHILDGRLQIAATLVAFVLSAVIGVSFSMFGLIAVFEYGSVQISFSQADVTAMQNATSAISFPAQLRNTDGSVLSIPKADMSDNNPQVGERILAVQLNDHTVTPSRGSLSIYIYKKTDVSLSADSKVVNLVVDLAKHMCRDVHFNPGQYSLIVLEYETVEDFRASHGDWNEPIGPDLGHFIAETSFTMPQLPAPQNCGSYPDHGGYGEDQFNENTMEIVYVSDSNVAFQIRRVDVPNFDQDDAGFFQWNLVSHAENAYYEFLIRDSANQVLFKNNLTAATKGVKEFKDGVGNILSIEYAINDPTLLLKAGVYTTELNFVNPSPEGSQTPSSTLIGKEEFTFGKITEVAVIESATTELSDVDMTEESSDNPPGLDTVTENLPITPYLILPGDRSDDDEEDEEIDSRDSELADEIAALADEVSELSEDVAHLTEDDDGSEDGGSADTSGDTDDTSAGSSDEQPVRCFDVETEYWAYGIINDLLDSRSYPIIRINKTTICRPLTPVLRKEFTAWLLEVYEPEEILDIALVDMDENPFPDVKETDPYAPYIIKAAELGIIHGHADGTFKPDSQINRAETLKILLRSSHLFNALGDEVSVLRAANLDEEPKARFSDVYDNQWYYSYLYYAMVNDIIQGYGDGTARMEQGVIFSEAAKILYLARELEGVL